MILLIVNIIHVTIANSFWQYFWKDIASAVTYVCVELIHSLRYKNLHAHPVWIISKANICMLRISVPFENKHFHRKICNTLFRMKPGYDYLICDQLVRKPYIWVYIIIPFTLYLCFLVIFHLRFHNLYIMQSRLHNSFNYGMQILT